MANQKQPGTPLELDFVIVDDSVNRYGYRILVEGINLDGFLKNPVCPLQHNTYDVSVGRWKNLKVEGGRLTGTLEFDGDDESAVKLYNKYKKGYMNAVSLAIIPIEESDDPMYLLPGQKYPTVTKSELLEVSLVTVPGQKNAVRLVKPDGTAYQLSLLTKNRSMENEKNLEQLQQELAEARRLNAENLVKLHKARGVVQDEEEQSLITLALTDYKSVSQLLEARKTNGSNDLAKQLVALHAERLGLTAEEVAFYEKAATADYEGTRRVLEARKGKDALDTFLLNMKSTPAAGADDRSSWTYLDWYKKDLPGLQLMAKNDPDRFKRLEADFLNESKRQGIYPAGNEIV